LGLLVGNTGTNKYQQIQTDAGVSGMCAGYNTPGSFLTSPPPVVAQDRRRQLLQSLSSVTFDSASRLVTGPHNAWASHSASSRHRHRRHLGHLGHRRGLVVRIGGGNCCKAAVQAIAT
jgi:hypothetical protein